MVTPLLALGDAQYVSLTTFRRSGVGVPTAVWVARSDADGALVVTTMATTGKAKWIRNDPRVTLVPCSRSGQVEPDAVPVEGRAEIVGDPAEVRRLSRPLRRKYGLLFAAFMAVGGLSRRRRADRVILRIVPGPTVPGSERG